MVITRKLSSSTQIQFLSAVKFWWERILDRQPLELDLRPRKEKKLPAVLSQQEVMRLFQVTENLKHHCILMIIYSDGLRLSEACRLRVEDIHTDRREIFVHGGKGKKDRFTTLSERMLVQLRLYLQEYRPDYFIGYLKGKVAVLMRHDQCRQFYDAERKKQELTLWQLFTPFVIATPPTFWSRELVYVIPKYY